MWNWLVWCVNRIQNHQHTGADQSSTLGTGVVTSDMVLDGTLVLTDFASGVAASPWTPVLAGTGTAGVFTYTLQVGRYCRIGPLVFLQFTIRIGSVDTPPTGTMTVSIPVASANVTNNNAAVTVEFSSIDLTAGYTTIVGIITPNTSIMTPYQLGDNVSNSALPAAAIVAGSQLIAAGMYFAA